MMKSGTKSRLAWRLSTTAIGSIALATGLTMTVACADTVASPSAQSGDWTTYAKTFDGHRFADLKDINASNVRNLHVAWTMHLSGVEGGGIQGHGRLEGTPIAKDGVLYVTDGWGSVYAIDVRAGGKQLWKMDPKTDHDWAGAIACCGINNRGVALWNDLVVSHTLDGRLVATDKATGTVKWQLQVADPDKGESVTAAPLVVKDLAITGVGGGEYGIRGWIAATDLNTGKEVWRTHTIPAKGEPGSESWKDDHGAITVGGGATWVTGTYDPKSNAIFWGVGNPGPDWDSAFRPGDNLYTDSILALDADTGKIKWHFQTTPNDAFDYDGVNESVLIDVNFQGKERAMAVHADRNGFVYAIDRNDGSFIWGSPFVKKLTWTKGLDSKTGKPVEYDPAKPVQLYNAAVTPSATNPVTTICPTNNGGKNWPPTAYNPDLVPEGGRGAKDARPVRQLRFGNRF
jgi:alcohol dehydrogenase (cytochrome c)